MLSFTKILERQHSAASIKEHILNFDKLDENIENNDQKSLTVEYDWPIDG